MPFVRLGPAEVVLHRDGGDRDVGAVDEGDEDSCEEQQHDGVVTRPRRPLASPRALDMKASPDAMALMHMSVGGVSGNLRDMNQALKIGPLSLPYSVLPTLSPLRLGIRRDRLARAAAPRSSRRDADAARRPGCARLAFASAMARSVLRCPAGHPEYRDGDWEPSGRRSGLLFGLRRARGAWLLRKPVLAAVSTTGTVRRSAASSPSRWRCGSAIAAADPEFAGGRAVSIADFAGRPTWSTRATWCPPCRRDCRRCSGTGRQPRPEDRLRHPGRRVTHRRRSPRPAGLVLSNASVDPESRTGAARPPRLAAYAVFNAYGELRTFASASCRKPRHSTTGKPSRPITRDTVTPRGRDATTRFRPGQPRGVAGPRRVRAPSISGPFSARVWRALTPGHRAPSGMPQGDARTPQQGRVDLHDIRIRDAELDRGDDVGHVSARRSPDQRLGVGLLTDVVSVV